MSDQTLLGNPDIAFAQKLRVFEQQEMSLYILEYMHWMLTNPSPPPPFDDSRGGDMWDVLEDMITVYHQRGQDATVAWFHSQFKKERSIFYHMYHERYVGSFIPSQFTWSKMESLPVMEHLHSDLLYKEGLHILYGASGVGKSFFALDLAIRVSHQEEVYYFAAEGLRAFPERLNAWMNYHEQQPDKLSFFDRNMPLMDKAQIVQFISEVQKHNQKPRLIILDTLSWCIAGHDENSAGVVSTMLENCRYMQQELQCALLLIHHSGKKSDSERGSSAIRAGVDMMLKMEDSDGTIVLTCEKDKYNEAFTPRYYRKQLVPVKNNRQCLVLLPTHKDTPADQITPSQRAVLDFLALETFRQSGARSNIIQANVTVGNIWRVLSNLKQQGYIKQSTKGDPFTITEKGLVAIGHTTATSPTLSVSGGQPAITEPMFKTVPVQPVVVSPTPTITSTVHPVGELPHHLHTPPPPFMGGGNGGKHQGSRVRLRRKKR